MEGCNGVDLMVDLETLGTAESAPIVSIGAVLFDPQASDTFESLYSRSFLRLIDIEDAINVCGPAEAGTIKWWLQQDDKAIKRLVNGEQVSLKTALTDLYIYTHVRGDRFPEVSRLPIPTRIWAKSPDFDCTKLDAACRKLKMKDPFPYYTRRCVRTAQDLAFPNGELPEFRGGVHHDARDDAVNQALMIQACYRALGMSRDQVTYQKQLVGRVQ